VIRPSVWRLTRGIVFGQILLPIRSIRREKGVELDALRGRL